MIGQSIPDQPRVSRPKFASKGIGEIVIFCLLLAVVWFYNAHIRHDPQFAVMCTPPLLIGLVFAAWEAFFPSAYPSRLPEGSPQLKRLKRWRLALILSGIGFMVGALAYIVASDSVRFLNIFAIPGYLCVCAWITLIAYIRVRTSSGS